MRRQERGQALAERRKIMPPWLKYRATNKNQVLSYQKVAALLQPFHVELSSEQADAVQQYVSLLNAWNEKISLTSITEQAEIIRRHFGESMFAARTAPIQNGRLADVGSGAGFPGLALKILCPRLYVFLVEPNGKKAAFLAEVKRSLNLDGVSILRRRFEGLGDEPADLDFIAARALGNLERLFKHARSKLSRDGQIILWLGAEDARTVARNRRWVWRDPAKIPGSERRVLLIGRPLRD